LFFSGYTASNGWELWRHDGTTATLFKDILPTRFDVQGESGSWLYGPYMLIEAGDSLFFQAHVIGLSMDRFGNLEEFLVNHLWHSDGTPEGTIPLLALTKFGVQQLRSQVAVGNSLFFSAWNDTFTQLVLWKSDGTAAGTLPLQAIPSDVYTWKAVGSRLFFEASDALHGRELWTSDGTPAGTGLVKDIFPGPSSSWIGSGEISMAAIGNTLYFTADDGSSGFELWKSDGTAAGTVVVRDLTPEHAGFGLHSGSQPGWLTVVGNTLYFRTMYNSLSGHYLSPELWKSDGTPAGTVPVADLVPEGSAYWDSFGTPTFVGTTLFFRGLDQSNGTEFWALDVMDDLFSTHEAQGNTKLLRGINDGLAYVQIGFTTTPITFLGSPTSPGDASTPWQMLAAETIDGANKLLWRYNPTGQVHVWALDSSWGWTGADTGIVDPSSGAGSNLLVQFGLASIE
jgi:ELWxxDGT repeat protein